MGTLLFIGGAIVTVAAIIYVDNKRNPDRKVDSTPTANNPFSEWEEKQPYNP